MLSDFVEHDDGRLTAEKVVAVIPIVETPILQTPVGPGLSRSNCDAFAHWSDPNEGEREQRATMRFRLYGRRGGMRVLLSDAPGLWVQREPCLVGQGRGPYDAFELTAQTCDTNAVLPGLALTASLVAYRGAGLPLQRAFRGPYCAPWWTPEQIAATTTDALAYDDALLNPTTDSHELRFLRQLSWTLSGSSDRYVQLFWRESVPSDGAIPFAEMMGNGAGGANGAFDFRDRSVDELANDGYPSGGNVAGSSGPSSRMRLWIAVSSTQGTLTLDALTSVSWVAEVRTRRLGDG